MPEQSRGKQKQYLSPLAADAYKPDGNPNKMSSYLKVPKTPSVGDLKRREAGFVNDAVVTRNSTRKFPARDVIPEYDARKDKHARGYFTKVEAAAKRGANRSAETNDE